MLKPLLMDKAIHCSPLRPASTFHPLTGNGIAVCAILLTRADNHKIIRNAAHLISNTGTTDCLCLLQGVGMYDLIKNES